LELRDGRILSWAGGLSSNDRTLRLWRADGTPLRTLEGHTGWVSGALELRDGRILSWAHDDTLRLWSAESTLLDTLDESRRGGDRARIYTWAKQHSFDAAELFTDEPLLGGMRVNAFDQRLTLYDPATGATVVNFYGDAKFTTNPVVLSNGVIVVGDRAGRV